MERGGDRGGGWQSIVCANRLVWQRMATSTGAGRRTKKRAPTTIVTKTVASLVSPNDEQCFVVPPEIRSGKLKARRHEHPGYWNVE